MGRPPKGSKLPYQALEELQRYAYAVHRDPDGSLLPQRLVPVIAALLVRLQRIDEDDYEYCLRTILTIHNLDNLRFASPERIEEEVDVELRNLALGKPSRKSHHLGTLQSQRATLLSYFEQHQYPTKARNDHTRIEWIAVHWATFMEKLTGVPCDSACNYTVDVKEFPRTVMIPKKHKWRRPVETVNLILARLHNIGISYIESRFKEKSPS